MCWLTPVSSPARNPAARSRCAFGPSPCARPWTGCAVTSAFGRTVWIASPSMPRPRKLRRGEEGDDVAHARASEQGRIIHIDNIGLVRPGLEHTTGFGTYK